MWIPFSGGRGWSCDQCRSKVGLRQKRGNCGGPFKSGLPLSEEDSQGRYISGYRVAPNCGEWYSDLKVRSCPVAGMNKMASIITAFNRHQAGLIRLTETFPNPSCAIVECFDILNSSTMEMQRRSHEQKMKELNNGSQ